jgi:hypothetical protein
MVTIASLAALGLAFLLASRLLPARRELLVVAVLALPILVRLPSTLRHEGVEVRQNRHVDMRTAEVAAPFLRGPYHRAEHFAEVRFLVAARRIVPESARVGFTADPNQTWIRWAAWGLAPRLVLPGVAAPWLILRDSPAEGLGRVVLRVGDYTLVRR